LLGPQTGRLRDTIAAGGSVFWIVTEASGLTCEEWRFRGSRRIASSDGTMSLDSRLERRGSSKRTRIRWYPATYVTLPDGSTRLRLDHGRPNPFKCECSFDYRVLADHEDLFLTTGRLPNGAAAYLVEDAERWYFSKSACGAAATAIAARIAADPAATTKSGIHVKEGLE
jgi:hypothetical protein